MRDIRNVVLRVYPVKYNPSTEEIKVYTDLTVKIEYYGISYVNVLKPLSRPISQSWDRMYRSIFLNYDYLNLNIESSFNNRNIGKTSSSGSPDLLIITHDYYDAIDDLKDHKEQQRIDIITRISLYPDSTGSGQDNLKNYIESKYNEYEMSYVMLVGDIGDIPWYADDDTLGDYEYACISDDPYADIGIGRISASSAYYVGNMVDKIKKYEAYPPGGYYPPPGDWWKDALLIAAEDYYFSFKGKKEEIKELEYSNFEPTFITIYGEDGAKNSDITDEIEDGSGIVNFLGHGASYYWGNWGIDGDYDKDDVYELCNGFMTPIVFSIACYTNNIDYVSECFGEAFTRYYANGAVAFLGASDTTYYPHTGIYDEELFSSIFIDGVENIGLASNEAAKEIIDIDRFGRVSARRFLWLGDPSLKVWTDTPLQPPLVVEIIDGPDTVWWNDDDPTWTADASGGYPDYSYQWYKRNEGEGWDTLEGKTSNQLTLAIGSITCDFDVKIEVTDDESQTDNDILEVTYIPQPPPPPALDVEIDGNHLPYAYWDQDNTWWAETSGGTPPYNTFAWSMRVWWEEHEEWSDWESVGSDSIHTIYESEDDWYDLEELFEEYDFGIGSDFQLKAAVTDNAEDTELDTIDLQLVESPKKETEQLPKDFKLEQNYPNPFNPVTTIKFQLPKASNVTLMIYNIQGQEVARLVDGNLEGGYHSINWKPGNAASGIYIYMLQAGSFSDIKRMLYIK